MYGRCVLACLCCALAMPAAAQETINYASVGGRVTDQQGGVVPGAAVTARQTNTNATAKSATNTRISPSTKAPAAFRCTATG